MSLSNKLADMLATGIPDDVLAPLLNVAIAANNMNTAHGWREHELDEADLTAALNALDVAVDSATTPANS